MEGRGEMLVAAAKAWFERKPPTMGPDARQRRICVQGTGGSISACGVDCAFGFAGASCGRWLAHFRPL